MDQSCMNISHSVISNSLQMPWIVACQAPLSMEFSRQEYWNELPFSSPGHLPDPGTESRSPALQADSLPSETPGNPSVMIPSQLVGKSRGVNCSRSQSWFVSE